jgi:outer membrane protein TolC
VETLLNNLARTLQQGAALAFDRAEELARLTRARLDLAATKNQIHRARAALGALAHQYLSSGRGAELGAHPEAQTLSQRLSALAQELEEQQAALEALQRTRAVPPRENDEDSLGADSASPAGQ